MGPKRIWLPDQNIPGLSMTRSFGDSLAATIGLTAEPDLVQYQVSEAVCPRAVFGPRKGAGSATLQSLHNCPSFLCFSRLPSEGISETACRAKYIAAAAAGVTIGKLSSCTRFTLHMSHPVAKRHLELAWVEPLCSRLTPWLRMQQVKATDRYLVLCSDGVFEFMSNAEVIATVHMLAEQGHRPCDIATFLVRSLELLPPQCSRRSCQPVPCLAVHVLTCSCQPAGRTSSLVSLLRARQLEQVSTLQFVAHN